MKPQITTVGPFVALHYGKTFPTDEYFVMGDNRRNSSDSRTWGSVRREAIWARMVDR